MESETNNFLKWVEIKNFKSIKDLRLDCKRVNVFIGKPNVGKSNILEGLGLLGAAYSRGKFMAGSVRYEDLSQLFFDNDIDNLIEISTDTRRYSLSRPLISGFVGERGSIPPSNRSHLTFTCLSTETYLKRLLLTSPDSDLRFMTQQMGDARIDISDNNGLQSFLTERAEGEFKVTKKYDFSNLTKFENLFQGYLIPPNGSNLYEVVRRNEELWAEFAKLFSEQNLELVLYDQKQEFILQKKKSPYVWQYPFFSIADTFRRFMFYITAIESNKNSVIIFEEPEVHSFPPYVKALAHRIVDSETNQFFISTHSPYMLQTLIREVDATSLSVFITYYQDYQTHVRVLTADELQEAEDLSIDLFYNLSRYEPNA